MAKKSSIDFNLQEQGGSKKLYKGDGKSDAKNDAFLLASWNIRTFSWSRCKNKVFVERIAETVSKFHLVALQEVRHHEVLRYLAMVFWKYEHSEALGLLDAENEEDEEESKRDQNVGDELEEKASVEHIQGGMSTLKLTPEKKKKTTSYTEYLAFIYRSDVVDVVRSTLELRVNPNNITRVPFTRKFKIESLDLTLALVNVHTAPTRAEVEVAEIGRDLPRLANAVRGGAKLGVLGDFNLNPRRTFVALNKESMVALINDRTMVSGENVNDNIFLDRNKFMDNGTTFFISSGVYYIDDIYLGTSRGNMELRDRRQFGYDLSDHLPVWAAFIVKKWKDERAYAEIPESTYQKPDDARSRSVRGKPKNDTTTNKKVGKKDDNKNSARKDGNKKGDKKKKKSNNRT